MGIDLKKIESMRADLQREREAAAVGKNRERKRSAIDRAEQRRIEKFERIDKIIDGLQATIEAATLKGNRFADLLSISADELLHQPSEYFFSKMIEVHIGGGNPHRILRGYKPDCLPDYARKLFNYCEQNRLITLFKQGNDYFDGFNSANMPNWKRYSYHIEIFW